MIPRALCFSIALAVLPLAAAADQVRLLAIGDSLTAGYGLAPRDGLVPQLQGWLRKRGHDVLVLNAGISGDTTEGGAKRVTAEIRANHPDAVIVELGGNDLLMDLPPRIPEANLDSILTQIDAAGLPALLVGIGRPERNERLRRSWAEIWPRLGARHGVLVHDNLYGPLLLLPESQRAHVLQEDQIHASKAGVAMIVEALGPRVEALIAEVEASKLAVGG
ncbi:GDSL-type esterase/lipase family protein [Paracoccus sp. NGMCC 1.201697]|uniref:GDSL-type esterase/lipase family protein n=1 Tax=Paracoccus broussonetiae subsp. drimophilus TaxID=3373869 RepID=A0ABW7LN37_9RHOB